MIRFRRGEESELLYRSLEFIQALPRNGPASFSVFSPPEEWGPQEKEQFHIDDFQRPAEAFK